jgi:uncharacterized membrane protein
MARMPGIRRHLSCSSQFIAALPRWFPSFVDAGECPEHLYLEEPQWMLKEQSFWLRLTTCCATIAGLFASLAFVG